MLYHPKWIATSLDTTHRFSVVSLRKLQEIKSKIGDILATCKVVFLGFHRLNQHLQKEFTWCGKHWKNQKQSDFNKWFPMVSPVWVWIPLPQPYILCQNSPCRNQLSHSWLTGLFFLVQFRWPDAFCLCQCHRGFYRKWKQPIPKHQSCYRAKYGKVQENTTTETWISHGMKVSTGFAHRLSRCQRFSLCQKSSSFSQINMKIKPKDAESN